MRRACLPPLKPAKEQATCAGCGEIVVIPPGRYYRGKPYHKAEAEHREQEDFGTEQKAPYFAEVERELGLVLDSEAT